MDLEDTNQAYLGGWYLWMSNIWCQYKYKSGSSGFKYVSYDTGLGVIYLKGICDCDWDVTERPLAAEITYCAFKWQ